jgi:hypothetical protein
MRLSHPFQVEDTTIQEIKELELLPNMILIRWSRSLVLAHKVCDMNSIVHYVSQNEIIPHSEK